MYEIQVYDKSQLDELPDDVHDAVVDEIQTVAEQRNPNSHRKTEKLNTNRDLYKLKVRKHRVIFGIVGRFLIVFRVCYRGDAQVYRNLGHLEDLWDKAQAEATANANV